MRIAMWSGPRNLSTAMMYSFGSRSDFEVMDEPFYASYLYRAGINHPMRQEIIENHETDPNIVAALCQVDPQGNRHLYMKHMPHHMLPEFPMDWCETCVNVHLVRHPARVIASYASKREAPTLQDIGYVQQIELYRRLGGVVVDSTDIRQNSKRLLTLLCESIDLDFQESMLKWKSGPKPEDGIWAKHWYGSVHQSTGFAGVEGPLPNLSADNRELLERALPYYQEMWEKRLQ